MINSIIESISISLNAEFGDRYKTHREAKRQGLKEPCFFVQCLNPRKNCFSGSGISGRTNFVFSISRKISYTGSKNVMPLVNGFFLVWNIWMLAVIW